MDSKWWKGVGALKDVASIWFAKLNITTGSIDIAVVKATEHNDIPPKEEHVLVALTATESSESRERLTFVVERRLSSTKDWMVAVKTLALIHRLMTDASPSISVDIEIMHSAACTSLCFDDSSSPLASDCSLWVRKYSCYLYLRMLCNQAFKCDILSERHNQRINDLDVRNFFIGLQLMQGLLNCLLHCTPQEGQVVENCLIQYALELLVKEGPKIYGIINNLICKLVDTFLVLSKDNVVTLNNIYRRFYYQSSRLSGFYDNYRLLLPPDNIGLCRVEKPSDAFVAKMSDHVRQCAEGHTASKKELTAKDRKPKAPHTAGIEATQKTVHTGGKEATQLVAPAVSKEEATEERLLITWWDADDDVPPKIEEGSTHNDCGLALNCGAINASCNCKHEGSITYPRIELEDNTEQLVQLMPTEHQQQQQQSRLYQGAPHYYPKNPFGGN